MAHCRLKRLYCVDLSVRLFLYTCWDQKDLVTDPMVLFQYLRSRENIVFILISKRMKIDYKCFIL